MKKLLLFVLLSAILAVMIVSCKKDDNTTPDPDPNPPTGHDTLYYVKYLGTKYEIDKCHVFVEDGFGSNGDYSIYLASSTVTYSAPPINDIYGTGSGIKLRVHTDNSSLFYHSQYAIDTVGTPAELYYLKNNGVIYINEDFFIDGTNISLVSGSCSIVSMGSNVYELSANLIKYPNIPIVVYFKGEIPIHPAQ